ncbi:MAG TPA: hypothetical protein VL486_13760 [Verrucomicrobiae bacterium]|nr:hypothetical protein [Verrucomicrobiae bacterium]
MKKTILSVIGCFAMVVMANAEIVWDVTNSTYNGTAFVPVEEAPGMGQAGSGDTAAYAGGSMDGDVFHMGFQVSPPGSTNNNEDLQGTALDAGTRVTLAFTKDASDYINYIAMNADATAGVSLVQLTPTDFTVSFTVVNPVLSASGDLGAAFGMGINISTNSAVDYGGSVFVANLCPGDVTDPINPTSGAMTINAQGSNGVTATFVMYASSNWMTRVGMISPALAAGYFSDTNGIRTALPPGFIMSANGYYNLEAGVLTNSANSDSYCFELQNGVWSAHDLGIATITNWAPMIVGKLHAKVNFAKENNDTCLLKATVDLGSGFDVTNTVVALDIGGAHASFTLNKKGVGHATSPVGSCMLSHKKASALWTLTANLKKGSWRTPWADSGLTNGTLKAGVPVTMPVVVGVGEDSAFTNNCSLTYRAVANRSGTAK